MSTKRASYTRSSLKEAVAVAALLNESTQQTSPRKAKARRKQIKPKEGYGRWSTDEHKRFLEAIDKYGNVWKKVEAYIGTRSCAQIRSHCQKYFGGLCTKAIEAAKRNNELGKKLFVVIKAYRNHSRDPEFITWEDEKVVKNEIKTNQLQALTVTSNNKSVDPLYDTEGIESDKLDYADYMNPVYDNDSIDLSMAFQATDYYYNKQEENEAGLLPALTGKRETTDWDLCQPPGLLNKVKYEI